VFDGADEADSKLRARALRVRGGTLYIVGEFERGMEFYNQSLALYRELGDEWGQAHMLHRLAIDASRIGDDERALQLSEETLAVSRRLGDRKGEALALSNLGLVASKGGEADRAIELFRQSARLAHEVGFDWWEAGALLNVGDVALSAGRLDEAEEALRAGVGIGKAVGDRQNLVYGLALLAQIAHERGQLERAGVLWGGVEAEEQRGPIGQWEADRHEVADVLLARPNADFERGRAQGRGLSMDETVDHALSLD